MSYGVMHQLESTIEVEGREDALTSGHGHGRVSIAFD